VTALATDNFNRANEAPIGSPWATTSLGAGISLVSNAVIAATPSTNHLSRYDGGISWPADHYSQAVITNVGTNTGGPAVRVQANGDNYQIVNDSGTIRLFRVISGGFVSLEDTAVTVANGDVIRVVASGTTISILKNGVTAASQTDANISGGMPGIYLYDAVSTWDDWEGGDLNVGPPVITTQEGYRFRNDDGDETAATWAASQDSNITAPTGSNRRLRVLVDTEEDLGSTAFQLEYKLSSLSLYRKVEAAGGGALAYGAIGTVTTTGTTAPTVAYPAGISAGDCLIMAVANRPNAQTPATPSGWSALTSYTTTGGAGSEAAGTGTVRITVFVKINADGIIGADGTETGSVTLAITSGTSCGAAIWRCGKTTGKDWAVALANGSDNSAGTAWSVTFGADPGVTAGDLVFVASAASEDTATFASQALAQTGMTYGTMNERTDTAITTGNDLRLIITQHAVTSGTSSAPAVFTMTASGTNAANSAGASVMIRLRQVDQPIQLSLSSQFTDGTDTTAQLTAPSGKTTSDFTAGELCETSNPAPAIDIAADFYSELEWCLQATAAASNAQAYQFRVTENGAAFDTYSVTPQWTIGTPGGEPLPVTRVSLTAVSRSSFH
jgi:hypothetical protein